MLTKVWSKHSKGITLTEMVIVLVIIGALAAISFPAYTSYVRKGYSGEGLALCNSIATAEKMYFADNNFFFPIVGVAGVNTIGTVSLNTSVNTYFRTFRVTITGGVNPTFTITTAGVAGGKAAGIAITYTGSVNAVPTIVVAGI